MKLKHTPHHRLDCHIQDVVLRDVDVSQRQQFMGYHTLGKEEFKISTLKNELMYRPSNKFNINDSLRSFTPSQSRQGSIQQSQDPPTRTPSRVEKLKLMHAGLDASSDTSTLITSSRSNFSHAMEQNSLFQLRDSDSIANYIAQITEREKIESEQQSVISTEQDHTVHGIPRPIPSYLSTEEAMHFSIKCNNLAQWSIDSSNVRVKTINFKIIQSIIYRESVILRMKEVICLIDKCYWKYCVHRIREFTESQSVNSENLVLRRNQIFGLQNELSVGIAHMRSLTMTITELVQKLRTYVDKELQMYWLGFAPNGLMVPPKDHDPMELWKRHSVDLMDAFLQARKRDLHLKASTQKNGKGKLKHSEQAKRSATEASLKDQMVFPLVVADATGIIPPHKEDRHDKGNSNVDEWQQLREYCSYSWTKVEIDQWPDSFRVIDDSSTVSNQHNHSWIQSATLNPQFWNNPNHNPLVIEAAIGFPEVFPSIYLVPPLPSTLLSSCLRLQEVLHQEFRRKRQLEELQQISERQKEDHFKKHSIQLDGEISTTNVNQWMKLKLRQQGTASSLQGLSVEHLSSCLDSTTSRMMEKSLHEFAHENMSNSHDSTDWAFFLTSQDEKFHDLDDNTRCGSVESLKTVNLVDASAFKFFRLENCSVEYRKKLEEKIKDYRRVVDRGSNGLSTVRRSRNGIREVSRLHRKWIFMHVVVIQKICRGFIARMRVKSIRSRENWRRALVTIQTLCRGFLAKRKFRKMRHQYKIDTFLLRKGAVQRFRAAILITRFMRNAVNHHRMKKESALITNVNTSNKLVIQKFPVLSAGSAFRGILTDGSEMQRLEPNEECIADDTSRTQGFKQLESTDSTDDGLFSISDLNFDDVEKQKFERMQAIALIKRVNEGKVQRDSRRSSRLIPAKDLSTAFAKVQVKEFSKKERSLFNIGSVDLKSTVNSTNDVFVKPVHSKGQTNDLHIEGSDDCSSTTSKSKGGLSSICQSKDEIRSLPPLLSSDCSRSTSVSRLSFADHLTMKELKRRQKEAKETEQIRSVLHKFYNE